MQQAGGFSRSRQITAFLIVAIFLAGWFVPAIGSWTGPMLGVWFLGAAPPLGGFLLVFALNGTLSVLGHLPTLLHAGLAAEPNTIGSLLLSVAEGLLPFIIYRLLRPHLPHWLTILPLPLAALALASLQGTATAPPTLHLLVACTLLTCWQDDFRRQVVLPVLALAGLAIGSEILLEHIYPAAITTGAWGLLGILIVVALVRALRKTTVLSPEAVAILRSPQSLLPVTMSADGSRLQTVTGEQFGRSNGLFDFTRSEDLRDDNRKYNRLYQTIAGLYDDSLRISHALYGIDSYSYWNSYLGLLEIRPGDHVLETSVGTGLNFQCLPAGAQLTGVDLSSAMLGVAQQNFERWHLQATLYRANAEALPFADASFDVVFHVGGINFFNDRGKAIREMVRVARPGTRILIADETEEHVQQAYENIPYTQRFFRRRKTAVEPPVDLVPAEMEEVQCQTIWGNRFYVLTFRKPR